MSSGSSSGPSCSPCSAGRSGSQRHGGAATLSTLHIALPVYAVLDWILIGDRPRLPWRSLWLVLPYPLTWIAVVLFRGQTDGWVPYGFLLPSRGAGTLLLTSVGLLAMLLVAAAAVWGLGRARTAVLSSTDSVPTPR
ncbi:Pr6Pr family membrane protein [Microbacterium oleivorans]|uniref:Pr6Pr family membrane protein n=1 Tax=Microbacterium oleivorans TaxID=273677 RepID=UPI00190F5E5A